MTFVATVSGTAPTGTIAFTDGGVAHIRLRGGCRGHQRQHRDGGLHLQRAGGGQPSIMATYAGDAVNASSSNTLTQTITGSGGGAASTTTVASSANPAAVGATVTFTASVTGDAPTGTVTFTDGGNPVCAVVPLGAGGTATCSTNALAAGTHTIIASYGGDAGNMVSSGMVAQVINASGGGGGGAGTTMTTLVSSANPAAVGASVMFTATVTGAAPTGSVNFKDGAGSIANCAVVNLAAGSGNSRTATCTTTTLAVGTHSIVAKYSGDANNATSTSATISETITGAAGGAGAEGRLHAVQYALDRSASRDHHGDGH